MPERHRTIQPATRYRLYRLKRGVTLSEAARLAGFSLYVASVIERDPSRALPGQLERLREAVDRAAAEMAEASPEVAAR